jgi:hypothetical protein
VRPLLIRAHQTRIARHIGGEDRGEAADRRHGLSGGKVGLTKCSLKPAAALVSAIPDVASNDASVHAPRGWPDHGPGMSVPEARAVTYRPRHRHPLRHARA